MPQINATLKPITIGTMTGKSIQPCSMKMARGNTDDCAKLMAIIEVAPIIEPPDRSIPPEMITWVTPTARMPTTATCVIMIERRSLLNMKLWPTMNQPRASKTTIRTRSPRKAFISAGSVLRFRAENNPAAAPTSVILVPPHEMNPRRERSRRGP